MASKPTNKYTDDSIISLNPREFTRLRPSTYLGSNEYSTQLVKEVFSNSLDEHIIGNGNLIQIVIDTEENLYMIKDNGQGFPINVMREDGETVLQASFDVINTSGKYDDNGVYQGSVVGLNGIGSKLTNFLSKHLEVYSQNGKEYECCTFDDGIFTKRETGKSNKPSGTTVTWQPDPQFFQNKEANINELKKLFEEVSALCPELTIELSVNYGDPIIYHTQNGIQDLINSKVGDKELLSNRFALRKISGTNLFDVAVTYTSDYSENIIAYVNYGLTEAGVHISTLKAGMTRQINRYATDNNLLKKNEPALTQGELSEGLFVVFNIKANNVKYDSQTKTRVVDLDKTLINNVINNDFYDWLCNNSKDAKTVIDKAMTARKAREAAQKAKEGIRNAGSKGKKFINLPTKLVDAYSRDRTITECYIVEGSSAANGLIAKRDGKTQAVFPIRGKILSCRKATAAKVYANQEISNIVKALGLEIDKTTGKLIYDTRKLRYGKIVLAADADADGRIIRALLVNMFWWLCPELVINGHIYAARPPLYRVTNKKNEYQYILDDTALEKYKAEHLGESYSVNRLKGLGESSADETKEYLLLPKTRNIERLTVSDVEASDKMLECFFGTDVEIRRRYLLDHLDETILLEKEL